MNGTVLTITCLLLLPAGFSAVVAGQKQTDGDTSLVANAADSVSSPELALMIDVEDNAKMLRMDVRDLRARFQKMMEIEDSVALRSELESIERTLIMLERSSQALWQNSSRLLQRMRSEAAAKSEANEEP